MKTMKFKLIFLMMIAAPFFAGSSYGTGYLIKVKINGLGPDTCFLGGYYGQYNQVNDTAIANEKGELVFQGKKDLPGGIYFIIHKKVKLFEFIINGEQNISFETDTADYTKNMKIKGSKENIIFYEYLNYINGQQAQFGKYKERFDKFKDNKDSADYYKAKMTGIDENVKSYKTNFMKDNPDLLISKVFKASRDPEVPEAPILPNGRKDSVFQYRYYKAHYFDDIDFTDDRLLRTPVFHERLKKYLTEVVAQTPDSLCKEADILIEKARPNKEMFKYVIWYITYMAETSNIMGFDAIYVYMVEKYYKTNQCYWVSEKVLDNVVKRSDKLKPILLGKTAPNLIMQDTALVLRSLHEVKANYTVLLFWDPECGHCKTEVPEIHKFYLENKAALNMEVFAVCADTNMAKMKEFIKKNKLSWINVNGPRALTPPYGELYDIYSTPVIYILDSKKVILAKRIGFDKIGEFIQADIKRKAAAIKVEE